MTKGKLEKFSVSSSTDMNSISWSAGANPVNSPGSVSDAEPSPGTGGSSCCGIKSTGPTIDDSDACDEDILLGKGGGTHERSNRFHFYPRLIKKYTPAYRQVLGDYPRGSVGKQAALDSRVYSAIERELRVAGSRLVARVREGRDAGRFRVVRTADEVAGGALRRLPTGSRGRKQNKFQISINDAIKVEKYRDSVTEKL